MKKILLVLSATVATPALAAGWEYATSNNSQEYYQQSGYQGQYQQPRQGQYQQPSRGQYQQPRQSQYQQPRQGQYQQPRQGQYQQSGYQGQYQQPRQGQYQQPRQGQYQQQTQRRTPTARSYYNQPRPYNQSYTQKQQEDKLFYVTPRLGGSYMKFLDSDGLDGAFGLTANVAAGMYFGNFRADAEIAYHFDHELDSGKDYWGSWEINLNSLEFFVNGYYDFKSNSPLTPFVGAGIGVSKVDFSIDSSYASAEAEGDTVFGLAFSGGASYAITDMISFEGMGRGKYLFNEGSMIELELLAGLRFSF